MLEKTRRNRSVFVYIIFGFLIIIFIWGINPGNKGGSGGGGCSTSSNIVVSVDGTEATASTYLVADKHLEDYVEHDPRHPLTPRDKSYRALDAAIRIEILAQAAEDRGLRVKGDLIDDEIMNDKRGYFYLGGLRLDYTGQFFDDIDGKR